MSDSRHIQGRYNPIFRVCLYKFREKSFKIEEDIRTKFSDYKTMNFVTKVLEINESRYQPQMGLYHYNL